MENIPAVELTPRRIDIKPAFSLTTPEVSKEMAVSFLEIEKAGIDDADAKELIEKQKRRIEILFDGQKEKDESTLRKRILASIDGKLNTGDVVSLDEKKDLVSDRNFLNSLFNKVDSWRDPLTGLYNRRGSIEVLKMVAENPAFIFGDRYEEISKMGFSLMMMDIDFFKNINDKLGHEEGDRALVEFSRSIGESVRSTDIVVRFGGEEVLILALATDVNGAAAVDVKIAERVSRIKLGSSGEGIGFTYSAGVDNRKTWDDLVKMVNSEDPMTLSLFLHDADVALHEAKDAGRNRIKFAGK